MKETIYGYIRVSRREQNEARQEAAMRDFGIAKRFIYMDKQSGKDFERPAYQSSSPTSPRQSANSSTKGRQRDSPQQKPVA